MRKVSKIFAVLSLVMVMAAGSASAQVHFGVKASATLNNILTDRSGDAYQEDSYSNPLAFGFNVGVFGEYMFTNNMGVAAEILYAQQGCKDIWKDDNSEISITRKTNNINIPVLFRFYPMQELSLEIGPQFGLCFGGNNKSYTKLGNNENTVETSWADNEEDLQDVYNNSDLKTWNRFNLGVALGANYNFNFGLFVGARYTLGVTDLLNEIDLEGNTESIKSKNSVISVSVGYRF